MYVDNAGVLETSVVEAGKDLGGLCDLLDSMGLETHETEVSTVGGGPSALGLMESGWRPRPVRRVLLACGRASGGRLRGGPSRGQSGKYSSGT